MTPSCPTLSWKVNVRCQESTNMSQLTRYLNFLHAFACVIINKHIDCYRLAMVIFLTKITKTNRMTHWITYKILQSLECKMIKEFYLELSAANLINVTLQVSQAALSASHVHTINVKNCSLYTC